MTWHTIITYMHPPTPTHTNKLRPAGFLAQRLNKNLIYGEVHQTHKPFFQTSCTNLQHSQITHEKREINSYRYDAMLSLEGCVRRWWLWWGGGSLGTQIGSRLRMRPHSDALIWHLLLQTQSTGTLGGPRAEPRRRCN